MSDPCATGLSKLSATAAAEAPPAGCMGTKGHTRTGVALLGSTVQAVLARAHKPVFVVTPPTA